MHVPLPSVTKERTIGERVASGEVLGHSIVYQYTAMTYPDDCMQNNVHKREVVRLEVSEPPGK